MDQVVRDWLNHLLAWFSAVNKANGFLLGWTTARCAGAMLVARGAVWADRLPDRDSWVAVMEASAELLRVNPILGVIPISC